MGSVELQFGQCVRTCLFVGVALILEVRSVVVEGLRDRLRGVVGAAGALVVHGLYIGAELGGGGV